MSTSAHTISAEAPARRYNAAFATAAAITFSAVASAPTPIYRLYQETLGLTPFEITLIFAIYAITIVIAG